MSLPAIPNFFSQFLDDSGLPLSGGLLYSYAAGTSTPKATYTDAGGGTPNDNPVELDPNGRADIYLDGSYRFVLKDSAGNTIRDVDNVYALGDDDIPVLTSNPFTTERTAASATTVDLGANSEHMYLITGTTTIVSFGSSASLNNPLYFVRFSGNLTLTHNGTSMILPGSVNRAVKAGDTAIMQYLGSGNWKMIGCLPATGKTPVALNHSDFLTGQILQSASTSYTANAGLSTNIPNDDTIPQNTEGTEIITQPITPFRSDSIMEIVFEWIAAASASTLITGAIFVDSTADALGAGCNVAGGTSLPSIGRCVVRVTAGSTDVRTYKARLGGHTGTIRANGTTSARLFGGVAACWLHVREIKA